VRRIDLRTLALSDYLSHDAAGFAAIRDVCERPVAFRPGIP
jgi:hypothetical protein